MSPDTTEFFAQLERATFVPEPEFENVVFCQNDEDAAEPLRILDEDGHDACIAYLSQWHYPGEHETRHGDCGAGSSDTVYEDDNGYILAYNLPLGYVGLSYRIPADS